MRYKEKVVYIMKQSEDLVSVIVPIYNVEKYLNKCVDSIVNQTYKNLEIVLVDDGSTDDSGKICDEYAGKDSRIKVVHKENGGLSDARNNGIDISNGRYLAFIDSDDWIEPNMIEKMYSNAIENNADISVCQYEIVHSREAVINNNHGRIFVYEGTDIVLAMYKYAMFASHACNKIYGKELFNGIRYPVGKLYEDQYTTYKLLWKAKRLVCTEEKYYYYYMRNGSIVNGRFDEKKLDVLYATEEAAGFFKDRFNDVVPYVYYAWIANYAPMFVSAVAAGWNIKWFKDNRRIAFKNYWGYMRFNKVSKISKAFITAELIMPDLFASIIKYRRHIKYRKSGKYQL